MAKLDLKDKLAILADAAKYDASCASSGAPRRDSRDGTGVGSTSGGICHAYAPDGRCISLLKILLTNVCMFDCLYCVNRASSGVRRARFTVAEVVSLTIGFYKRNYIEGLFLSSGIIRSPDYTMEQVVRVARTLRQDHDFRGYIHLKTIPDADPRLIAEAGCYADRLSINVELPRADSVARLAPEKDAGRIRRAMGDLRARIEASRGDSADAARRGRRLAAFAPAGQSTQRLAMHPGMVCVAPGKPPARSGGEGDAGIGEPSRRRPAAFRAQPEGPHSRGRPPRRPACAMRQHRAAPPSSRTTTRVRRRPCRDALPTSPRIVGADRSSDGDVLRESAALYGAYRLSRVYYSAFSPIPAASPALPPEAPPLAREHRLYQADWLTRFYGMGVEEILAGGSGDMLDLEIDPKLAWALRHRDWFPVDVNRADRERLLRVPGLGVRAVDRLLSARRWRRLTPDDVARVSRGVRRSLPFLVAEGWHPGPSTDAADLRRRLVPQGRLARPRQLALFAA